MANPILITDDEVKFQPFFGPAIVSIPQNPKLSGSGKMTIGGKTVCLDGDEKNVKVENCNYISGTFLGGNGKVEVLMLLPPHKSIKTKDSGKAVLLGGMPFLAKFTVSSPGTDPATGMKDPVPMYPGVGEFVTNNDKYTTS